MSLLRSIVLTAGVVAISVTVGVVLALKTDLPRKILDDASYAVRTNLGLEKSWMALPGREQAEGRKSVACPDPSRTVVLVTGGQSNGTNVIPTKYEPSGAVFVWFDGKCYVGADPLLGTGGADGSLWSLLADRLQEQIRRPVLLINGAVGGTQYSDWLDDRSGYFEELQFRVSGARSAGYDPDLTLWHQGETDAAVLKDMSALEEDITVLTRRLTEDTGGARVYLFQATRCIGPERVDGVPAVREVQKRVADRLENVHAGFNTDLLGREYRWDTCHFNSRGREAIADQVVPELMQLLDEAGSPS